VSKKPIIGGIILAAIIGVVFVGAQINPDNPENEEVVFHVTLADPSQYTCNPQVIAYTCDDQWREYRDSVLLEKGEYMFRFVANGDSPEVLTVRIEDTSPYASFPGFKETFTLKGMPHESETSLYYTWSYDGLKRFKIASDDMGEGEDSEYFAIRINPNENLMGPVSVDLIKLR
jgi:hypothetical protein